MARVLEVRRDHVRTARVTVEPAAPLADGQVRFAVERFGLTANNVTYAVLGHVLGYWSFFPAADSWGRVPAWGYATAVESRSRGVPEGARVFGYVPMATELVLTAVPLDGGGLHDASPHRADLHPAYNRYLPAEPGGHDDELMILRPLFVTSVLLARRVATARRVVLSSASSKTALGTAFLLSRSGVEVVGLTGSPEFARGLGVYRDVLPYDAVEQLERRPTTFVDLAGDAAVRLALHRRLGDRLEASVLVGATHMRPEPPAEPLPGPEPAFFFAPDHLRDGLDREALASVRELIGWATGWLRIERRDGADAVLAAWAEAAGGGLPPTVALSLSLG